MLKRPDASATSPKRSTTITEEAWNLKFSTGMPYVIVNGTIVVNDSQVLPVKPGQPIRYRVEDEGRFEPASIERFIAETTILSGMYPTLDDSGAKKLHEGN